MAPGLKAIPELQGISLEVRGIEPDVSIHSLRQNNRPNRRLG